MPHGCVSVSVEQYQDGRGYWLNVPVIQHAHGTPKTRFGGAIYYMYDLRLCIHREFPTHSSQNRLGKETDNAWEAPKLHILAPQGRRMGKNKRGGKPWGRRGSGRIWNHPRNFGKNQQPVIGGRSVAFGLGGANGQTGARFHATNDFHQDNHPAMGTILNWQQQRQRRRRGQLLPCPPAQKGVWGLGGGVARSTVREGGAATVAGRAGGEGSLKMASHAGICEAYCYQQYQYQVQNDQLRWALGGEGVRGREASSAAVDSALAAAAGVVAEERWGVARTWKGSGGIHDNNVRQERHANLGRGKTARDSYNSSKRGIELFPTRAKRLSSFPTSTSSPTTGGTTCSAGTAMAAASKLASGGSDEQKASEGECGGGASPSAASATAAAAAAQGMESETEKGRARIVEEMARCAEVKIGLPGKDQVHLFHRFFYTIHTRTCSSLLQPNSGKLQCSARVTQKRTSLPEGPYIPSAVHTAVIPSVSLREHTDRKTSRLE